jgi:hypothetical protein
MAYEDRNPVWFSGGVEVDSPEGKALQWSQPEIGLYDDDPYLRMSYPDMVEENGEVYLTETQKDKARVHPIDRDLLESMWRQFDIDKVAREGLVLELPTAETATMPNTAHMPHIPALLQRDRNRADFGTQDLRRGFSVDLWFRLDTLDAGQILLDNRTPNGQGFCLQTTNQGTIELVLNDGRTENRWDCDQGLLKPDKLHHLVAIVDGGPKIISFVVDGTFNDGGENRQFGWGRYSPHLRGVNAAAVRGLDLSDMQQPTRLDDKKSALTLRIGTNLDGAILSVRLYNRHLLTSEAIGNFRAGAS